MPVNRTLNVYVIPVIISISIISVTVFTYYQLTTYQNQIIDNHKKEFTQAIENMITRRESRIETIGSAIIAFYEGSQLVEKDEFVTFNKRILVSNPEVLNTFVLKNNYIIQSYPHDEFLDKNSDEIFQTFPIQIEGINVLVAEFFMPDDMSVMVAVPFDYLVIESEILNDNYKLILTSPATNDTRLYEKERSSGNELHSGIVLSPDEIKDSITIQKSTNLYGYKLKQNWDLKYTVWDNSFVARTGSETIIVFTGFAMAIVIPILLIHSSRLRNKLQLKSVQLEKANQEIMQAEKAKDEFSAMVSHELKTPLAPIIGYCKMLKKTSMIGNLNSEQHEAVEAIERNAKQLEKLIGDVLDARKLGMDKMKFEIKEFSVKEFLSNLDSSYKKTMGDKGIKFIINSKIQDASIKSDKTRLQQVFDNLISNSEKVVPKQSGMIEIGADKNNGKIIFYVKDNGIGIPKEKQAALFQKFYQVDTSDRRKGGGTGLGLAISKGIVDKLGGKIWVESDGKTGTSFYIEF